MLVLSFLIGWSKISNLSECSKPASRNFTLENFFILSSPVVDVIKLFWEEIYIIEISP